MAKKSQNVGGIVHAVEYFYNSGGQLITLVTPSGQQISYTYLNGRIASVKLNGTSVAAGVVTVPFGAAGAWQWGSGQYTLRYFDTDGRLSSWQYGNGTTVLRNNLTYDAASRVVAIDDPISTSRSTVYQYDLADRLVVAQLGAPETGTTTFGYDLLGNRIASTTGGGGVSMTYGANSNRILTMGGAISPNYMGGSATLDFAYNNANRLTTIQRGGLPLATYAVNALGQRLKKDVVGNVTIFVYDERGRLLGEYNSAGQLIQETVWLDDLPIATLRPTGIGNPTPVAIYYVHADHLGSPRAITRPIDHAVLWRWDNAEPFGANPSNENPNGYGIFVYNQRFPGQYYDAESGTHYNYFRDYDGTVGRYLQSDPIGLGGGPNSYRYAGSNPLLFIDPDGLRPIPCPPQPPGTIVIGCDDGNGNENDPPRCVTAECAGGLPPIPSPGILDCISKCLVTKAGRTVVASGATYAAAYAAVMLLAPEITVPASILIIAVKQRYGVFYITAKIVWSVKECLEQCSTCRQ